MSLKLYNTLSRKIEDFKPIKKGTAGIYACGPTVYNYAHIGNLRTYVFEDILKRTLLYNNYKVKHIINITDVGHLTGDADEGEDKMAKGAAREGKTAWEIAKFYTLAFKKDLKDLNILPPNKFPNATDNIKEQIDLIKKLEKKCFTYKTNDGIYFDTAKLKDYGKLAQIDKQKLKAGARVSMGEKKNITDFALWKFSNSPPFQGGVGVVAEDNSRQANLRQTSSSLPLSKGERTKTPSEKRQMEWSSPWGVGFPGWHIECSAMSVKYLGQPFDIHCGGIDHVPVHHTNEIAQSEAANGKPLANYWLHGEFLLFGEDKMAKSADNFITLGILKTKNFNPIAFRYLLLQTNYRKQLNFSLEALAAAQNGLNHLYNIVKSWGKAGVGCAEYEQKFLEAINNDLDMPGALAIMWDLIKNPIYPGSSKKRTILKFDKVLGLGLIKLKKEKTSLPSKVQILINERDLARANKNWAESDEFRKKIEAAGYTVEDTPDGTKIMPILLQ
jgi:cysteinyl-tRNA synthetase